MPTSTGPSTETKPPEGAVCSERIKNWPTKERPRERLLAEGPGRLTDAELQAIILRVGPAQVCPNCGEAYGDEKVAGELLKSAEQMAKSGTLVDIREYMAAQVRKVRPAPRLFSQAILDKGNPLGAPR